MSDIDNDNLTDLPEGWVLLNLKDIVYYQEGPGIRKTEYRDKGIPFLNIRVFNNEKVNKDRCNYLDEGYVSTKYRHFLLNEGDIICSSSGTLCKTAIINKYDLPLMLNTSVIRFRSKNELLLQEFLHKYLKSIIFYNQAAAACTGSAQKNFGPSHLDKFLIILPQINEQKRIVAKIDEVLSQVSEIKEKLQHSRKLVDSFKKSVLTKAFKGELVPTEAELARRENRDYETASQLLAKINQTGTKTKNQPNIPPTDTEPSPDLPEGWIISTFGDNSFFVLNPKKSEINTLSDDEEITFVPMPSVSDIKGCILNPGKIKLGEVRKGYTYFRESDVLFAKITPCMENGKSAIALNLINGIGFGSTEFHVIRSKGYVLPNWIHLFVRREEFRGEAKDHMTGNVGQQRVPIRFIEETKIPIPPKEEQKRIVAKIDELYKLADEINDQIDKALVKVDNITQAVLRKAFKGELVPTEAELARREGRDYEPASVLLEKIKSQTRESSEKPKIQKKSKQER